ncbi:MAG TPA: glycosyltransferase [Capsulimonadaceae bacterium]|jgi:glycosyltransferase involved in cell wall biosynthesis
MPTGDQLMAMAQDEAQTVATDLDRGPLAGRSLRIGIFTESYPPVVNGVTTSVITLIDQLEKLGHKVFVFSSEFPGYTGDPDNVVRIPAAFTPFDKAYPVPFPITPRIMKGVGAMELDLIHTQSPFLMGIVAQRVAQANNVPLIATNHTIYTAYSHYIGFAPEELVNLSAYLWIGWYYTGCSTVITPSNFAASKLREEYGVPESRISVIPSGIPIPATISEEAKAAVRVKYGIPADAPVLIYAGRMAKEKNLRMLLASCESTIFKARPDAYLVLAGAGMYAARLQEITNASPILKGRVILTGFLPRAALDPIYATADLMTFPSTTETQGMVLGEAMAVGTPCVAVNEGGAPETVTDGEDGLRVPNDPVAYGEAVVALLNDPERLARMSAAAVVNAQCRTAECMADKVLAVYHSALTTAIPLRG